MSWELIVASIIFIATYAAISLRRLPGIEVGMHTAALIGAVLMMLFGIVSLTTAWGSLYLDVLFLLLGLMGALLQSLTKRSRADVQTEGGEG